ncbi:MAG: DUF2244 domain-containing protein [Pseudomonadota bacterium]|jgi:uncharacterized membrane protein|nr:DUF2244 domain-containing protein [Pseudomonadota bacterium]
MPYEWLPPETPDGPKVLHLWPYRSLPRRGFVVFIGITCGLLFLPLIAVLGSPILWGLLPFLVGVVALTWLMIERSYKDGSILEELRLTHDEVTLTRHNPRAPRQNWSANPYWVSVEMHPRGGPVEQYLTLRGSGREVEIGAFLTPDERLTLRDELQQELFAVKTQGPPAL